MNIINLKRSGIAIMLVVLLIVVASLGLIGDVITSGPVSAQDDKIGADDRGNFKRADFARENMIHQKLSALFSNQEVSFNEESLLPDRVENTKTVHVRFAREKGAAGGEFSEQKSRTTLIKQTALRTDDEPLTRQRAFELSPTQILIVSADARKQVLWWDLQPDPRILRAETADDNGILSGKTLYRSDAGLLVSFPGGNEITDLYFYSPNWNGETFDLELIGKLNLPSPKEVK